MFNSLSKRSNLPGMRSGFAAGDGDFLETLAEIRNLTAPQMPGVVQHASAAVWSEEQHVAVDPPGLSRQVRRLRRSCWTAASATSRPGGGFFLWLDMSHLGGGEQATLTIWKRCGVKVIPGVYLAQRIGTASIPATTTFASRSCTMRPPSGKRSSVSLQLRRNRVRVSWRIEVIGPLLPASLDGSAQGWLCKVLGVIVLAGCAAPAASLLTWSAADPSLTHATSGATRNLLGPPGAILSDLLMQMLGLAGVFVLLPPLFWALQLLSGEKRREACAAS